jgi:hypothetical protein
MLSEVAQGARQRSRSLAVSNPCFELWLLLHVSDDVAGLEACEECRARLRGAVGGWSKTGPMPAAIDAASVGLAVERAERLDLEPSDAWPQTIGTHVYRLVRRLLELAPARAS